MFKNPLDPMCPLYSSTSSLSFIKIEQPLAESDSPLINKYINITQHD